VFACRAAFRVLLAALVVAVVACAPMRPVAPDSGLAPVAAPADRPAPRFDARRGPLIEVRWHEGKTPLVHPLLNGQDVGWFVLDTGASGMTITEQAAQEAGLAPIGTTLLQGERLTTVYESRSFELGPMTLHGTRFAGMDMPGSSFTFGSAAVGFCGYDVFAGAVFVLEAEAGTAALHEPSAFELQVGRWEPLRIQRNLPHVVCRFEGDREGLFLIDAGFDGTIWIFADPAEEFGLLEDRPTRSRTIRNLGGSNPVEVGLLDWFELGEHRIDAVECAFSTEPVHVYAASPEVIGIVGIRFLREFRVVLDYGSARAAFIHRDEIAP
jgi:predicted aspartyl protease